VVGKDALLSFLLDQVTVHDKRPPLAVPGSVAEYNGYGGTKIEWSTGPHNRSAIWRLLAAAVDDVCAESFGVVIESGYRV
jgi:hypothetical protein